MKVRIIVQLLQIFGGYIRWTTQQSTAHARK
jgi:hypothetical protein